MKDIRNIDLHMHSTVSDDTDTPEELLGRVREAGLELFALTDHDAIKGVAGIRKALRAGDPQLLSGVEFSCKDEGGKYHILGYRFDPDNPAILDVVGAGHRLRMDKVMKRLDALRDEFQVTFPEEEIRRLLSLDNPGKPHIGNLMVKYGYARTKEEAIREKINKAHVRSEYIRPETAIRGILGSGGIPVLAHPAFGSGDEIIVGGAMEERLRHLTAFGLQGVEAFYSGFSPRLREETLAFAKQFGLYVTAGSDYHGRNKLVALGDTELPQAETVPDGLLRFLEAVQAV